MLNYILTAFIPILTIFIGGGKTKESDNAENLFSKDYTSVLKGICCIIVVMVHIREGYTNPLQDAIGSFAYVCVTLFFMISAYGMQFSVESKVDYLKHFWRNRLLALLIPCFLINIFAFVLFALLDNNFTFKHLWYINDYVLVLLEYCLWFYIVMQLKKVIPISKSWIVDALLCIGIILSSLISFFFSKDTTWSNLLGWRCERIGLIWGLLYYRLKPCVDQWLTRNRMQKIIIYTFWAFTLGVLYLKFKTVYFGGEYLLKIILGLSIILWILLLTVKKQFGNKISLWLGRISYEVYLLHTIVMLAIIKVIPSLSSGIFILMTYILTMLISTGLNWCSNKIVKMLRV